MRVAMIFLIPMMTLSILDIVNIEEAMLTMSESLYSKHKSLDIWCEKTVRICIKKLS